MYISSEVGKQLEMTVNIKYTKAIIVSKKPYSRRVNIVIDGQQIKQLTSYVTLGWELSMIYAKRTPIEER